MSTTVQDRVTDFETQLMAWLEQARPGVPIFVLPNVKTVKSGLCISCAAPIPTGWRCAPCLEAVTSVLAEFAK